MGRPQVRPLAVTLLLAASGCSALLGKPLPPDYGASQEPHCSGFTLPLIDTAVAALSTFVILQPDFVEENLLGYEKPAPGEMPTEAPPEARRRALFPALIFGASAIYGHIVAARCRKAHRDHANFEPFPVFAKRVFTDPGCQLTAQSLPDHGEIEGTVTRGLDSTTLKAVFVGKGDSWGCEPMLSEATSSAGVKRSACLILNDCRAKR